MSNHRQLSNDKSERQWELAERAGRETVKRGMLVEALETQVQPSDNESRQVSKCAKNNQLRSPLPFLVGIFAC
jgi:hypothetical protein